MNSVSNNIVRKKNQNTQLTSLVWWMYIEYCPHQGNAFSFQIDNYEIDYILDLKVSTKKKKKSDKQYL